MNENMNENYNPYTTPPESNPHKQPNEGPLYAHIPQPTSPGSGFELSALIFGFLSILSCSILYVSVILGALAILFALLSRGGKQKLSPRAKLGLILGIIGMVLTVLLSVYAFYLAFTQYGSIENLLREYCQMLGFDFEELYGNFFN